MESKKFEIHKDVPKKFEIQDRISINNGEFNVSLDKKAFEEICTQKNISGAEVGDIWEHLRKFNELVTQDKEKGVALGSTDPIAAISNEIRTYRLSRPSSEKTFVVHFTDDEIRRFVKES
jgi:hypothetical protein